MFFTCTSPKQYFEISSQKITHLWKFGGKYWTESPNEFLKKSEISSFFSYFLVKCIENDFVTMLALFESSSQKQLNLMQNDEK